MTDEPIVRVDGLVKHYGELVAVNGVSFSVARGEMFGLIGPDGAGKTTTLRVILGLLPADDGVVRAAGLDPLRQRRALAERVGYLSQRFSLYGDLSVDENVAFFAEIHGVRRWRARRGELLEMLRLAPFRKRLAERLSGGMKQKLALACTLIHAPQMLVLDEPTTGVDPVSRRDFWKILVQLQREGLTILLTTPYLDEAERCQRVGMMNRGQLVALDAPHEIRRQARLAVVEVLASPFAAAGMALRASADVAAVEQFGERLHATLAPSAVGDLPGALSRLREMLGRAECRVESVRSVEPSLEDVFIAQVSAASANDLRSEARS